MKQDTLSELEAGYKSAYIDGRYDSNLAYQPEFISNDHINGRKVVASLENELLHCEEFSISVAFIRQSGLVSLLMTLSELEKKNIPGKILTTDYLTFSEPKILRQLASFQNIELKMFRTRNQSPGFHTKGYIFKNQEIYRIIIGSSNLTASAITTNHEWNTKIVSTAKGKVAEDVLTEFQSFWNHECCLKYEDFIEEYEIEYRKSKIIKKQQRIALEEAVTDLDQYRLQPNKMQVEFTESIMQMLREGKDRGLLLSSTGTGKTLASAFAIREINPDKILFLVHREQIAKQTIVSYRKVFGGTKTYGLISGSSKEVQSDFIFSTIQSMTKEEIHRQFRPEEFDLIVLDECHHAGSGSYQKVMEYFTPRFWLGMTATPDTQNYDIYGLFHHQIAYEIRLQQALEEDLLCPFHYFGITDLQTEEESQRKSFYQREFQNLVTDARVDHVIQQAEFYGYSGNRVKGLIFCSRKDEARELSGKFNIRGYRTAVLTGEDSMGRREDLIERLAGDDSETSLDYIFTVDIFNEGVDIPEINQVIMLRPTESAVVFVQQLGRGLRKHQDKEFVNILDFIGNYKTNFMIPIALSGNRTYNKDAIRKYVVSGINIIPGKSTIHFDEIAKNRIFNSIDEMKGIKEVIRQSYQNLKNRLGRIPYLVDFYKEGEVDPLLILKHYKSYDGFLSVMEGREYDSQFDQSEKTTLEYLSKIVASGKRPHEIEILKEIIQNDTISKREIHTNLTRQFDIPVDMEGIDHAISVLQGNFVANDQEREKYTQIACLEQDSKGMLTRLSGFRDRLKNVEFTQQLEDVIELGLKKYRDSSARKEQVRGDFILYEKYSRRDVCLLLNWGRDYSSIMYGMKRNKENVCLFVTYHKVKSEKEDQYVDGKPDYADGFVDHRIFLWDSQIGKGTDSSYTKDILDATYKHLFVKKSDLETDFYYLGRFQILEFYGANKKDNSGKVRNITKFKFQMEDYVREDILKYLDSVDESVGNNIGKEVFGGIDEDN